MNESKVDYHNKHAILLAGMFKHWLYAYSTAKHLHASSHKNWGRSLLLPPRAPRTLASYATVATRAQAIYTNEACTSIFKHSHKLLVHAGRYTSSRLCAHDLT